MFQAGRLIVSVHPCYVSGIVTVETARGRETQLVILLELPHLIAHFCFIITEIMLLIPQLACLHFCFAPSIGCKVLQSAYFCVFLSVRSHISKTTCPISPNFIYMCIYIYPSQKKNCANLPFAPCLSIMNRFQ